MFKPMAYGMDFATSTIAIFNLITFEQQLKPYLGSFSPSLKFWSMKIPITLAFSQVIILRALQPWTEMTDSDVEILDAVSKGYCMVAVAFLNIFAWGPNEDWYLWEEVAARKTTVVGTVKPAQEIDEDDDSSMSDDLELGDSTAIGSVKADSVDYQIIPDSSPMLPVKTHNF